MIIREWLHDSMVRLRDAGVDSPRRDCLVLLEDLLEKDRAWVLTHHEYRLNAPQIDTLENKIQRRASREPLAYIRGKAWFYGRFFEVSPAVMIPRPESESFIEIIKELEPKQIIDVGTGSGCLAITAKLELPQAELIGIEESKKALKIAQKNAKNHGTKIRFLQGSLLEPASNLQPTSYNLIAANLPYVPDDLITSPEIEDEPKEALFSGSDGMDHYRKFWTQIDTLSQFPDYILVESLTSQHKMMRKLAKHADYKLAKTDNLAQLFKLQS
jgi:release factor glutamine methyltransferase